MKFYLNDKKISKKVLEEKFGKEKVVQRIKDAKETWSEDPYTQVSWMDGIRIPRRKTSHDGLNTSPQT